MKIFKFLSLVASIFLVSNFAYAINGDYDNTSSSGASGCIALQNNLRFRYSNDYNSNYEVSKLQGFLQDKSYLNSEPTGYFGLLTQNAVKSYQTAKGLASTGYVGSFTRAEIQKDSCSNGGQIFVCTQELRLCSDGSAMPRDADCTWRSDKCSNSNICPINTWVTSLTCVCPSGYHIDSTPSISTQRRCVLDTPTVSSIPNISSVSGPTTLNVNQNGTWTVNASVSDASNLTYSVKWGDEYAYAYNTMSMLPSYVSNTSNSFSHAYTTSGTYTITFTVTSSNGKSNQSVRTINVTNSNTQTFCPINTSFIVAGSNCVCPSGYMFSDVVIDGRNGCYPVSINNTSTSFCQVNTWLTNPTCTCPSGYVFENTSSYYYVGYVTKRCVTSQQNTNQCPLGTYFTDSSCSCPAGYSKSGNVFYGGMTQYICAII